MASGYGQGVMIERMIRAAKLDPQLYEEVEHDTTATTQAFTVVLVVAVATGIGHALGELLGGHPGAAVGGFIAGIAGALLGWVIWSYVTYFVGTKLFNGVATPGEMLRTIGFAHSPGVISIVSFIPFLGGLIAFAVSIWTLVATIIAMRQALDVDTTKAVLTALIGFIPAALISVILIGPFIALFAR
jgi:hypothetical protein